MFMMIITLGMFHGLILVPIVLLKIGPQGFFMFKQELESTEQQIVDQIMGRNPIVKDMLEQTENQESSTISNNYQK